MKTAKIVGTGSCLPGEPVKTEELEESLGYEKGWIERKIGVRERYWVIDYKTRKCKDETLCCNSDLSARAAAKAIENAHIKKEEIDLIIHSTCTPDYPIPPTAAIVQEKLGIENCSIMDIRSACTGIIQAITTATQYIKTGMFKNVLVIGTDVFSTFINYDVKNSKIAEQHLVNAAMLGDGSGAMILGGFDDAEDGILGCCFKSLGVGKEPGFFIPGGGCKHPSISYDVIDNELGYFHHNFREVAKSGPMLYLEGANEILEMTKWRDEDIDHIVLHQANVKKVAAIAQQVSKIPKEVFYNNGDLVGNTGSASIYIALDEMNRKGLLKKGDNVLLIAAEATKWLSGAIAVRWS